MKTTPRRSPAQWQSLIQQQVDSGHSIVQFCREHHLNHQHFSKRKRQLLTPAPAQSSDAFIKIQTAHPPKNAPTAMVLHYRNTQLHLSAGADLSALVPLMALLP
jgi:hypothetical protein